MPKKSLLGSLLLVLLLCSASCGHLRYRSTLPPSGRVYEQRHNFFLGGLIGDASIHLPSICPQGVHTLDVYHSLGNLFFSALTLGIYMPTTSRVHCAAPGGTTPNPGQMGGNSAAGRDGSVAAQAESLQQEGK